MAQLTIRRIDRDKRRFMKLLLIGDESETMIDRYIERGILYAGYLMDAPVAVCVAVEDNVGEVEVKNLAVLPEFRRKGIGRGMLEYVETCHKGKRIMLGTGETPSTLRFYRSCGFRYSHSIPDFFTDNYPYPIVEEGIRLKDMIYLVKEP